MRFFFVAIIAVLLWLFEALADKLAPCGFLLRGFFVCCFASMHVQAVFSVEEMFFAVDGVVLLRIVGEVYANEPLQLFEGYLFSISLLARKLASEPCALFGVSEFFAEFVADIGVMVSSIARELVDCVDQRFHFVQ